MLKTMTAVAPVVAVLLIGVLLVEPPSLGPGDPVPSLRVLTADRPAGLSRTEIEEAIRLGTTRRPPRYMLAAVAADGEVIPDTAAALVYTPFLRVAWAAHAHRAAGTELRPEEVPSWMAARVVSVAFLRPSGTRTPSSDETWMAAAVLVRRGGATATVDPSAVVPAQWVSAGGDAVAGFGAPVSASEVAVVAVFPERVMSEALEFVAIARGDDEARSASQIRARLQPPPRR